MKKLNKIEKALIVAQALDDGIDDYFDRCKRVAYALWDYYNAQTEKTERLTATELARAYDENPEDFEEDEEAE